MQTSRSGRLDHAIMDRGIVTVRDLLAETDHPISVNELAHRFDLRSIGERAHLCETIWALVDRGRLRLIRPARGGGGVRRYVRTGV